MPELPEVETIAAELRDSGLVGDKVADVDVFWPRTLLGEVIKVRQTLLGQLLTSVGRRGKYLLLHFSTTTLVVHLKMTGRFVLRQSLETDMPHERARLTFASGRILSFVDTRKFGRWQLVDNAYQHLQHLGLEPLTEAFTPQALEQAVGSSRTAIKVFLLNQTHIVGLGNIYVDEALWEAGIHPTTPAKTLTKQAICKLWTAIRLVLQRGIEYGGTSLGKGRGNYYTVQGIQGGHQHQLRVFRRQGQPCPRCQTIIAKMTLGQRSTHYCPSCQTK